ncbi:MAG TPA: hypothetical protein DDZ88_27550 [Verrucomicrobiales bacterium]|nr:hypothetical protein [Verrucomicrobiales bacterium]
MQKIEVQPPDPRVLAATRRRMEARRIAVVVIGGAVLLGGIAVWMLPGPAFIVIPAGLSILGSQLAWVRRWLKQVHAE